MRMKEATVDDVIRHGEIQAREVTAHHLFSIHSDAPKVLGQNPCNSELFLSALKVISCPRV